ncbi:MAG: TetR/AcrR family transcriptional regulator [Pseudomonadaceae bacterium]|nr:TetR/AcrR family transcriptional regulator [Pseudomonadaceae bacterium]
MKRSPGRPGIDREVLLARIAEVFRKHGFDGASLVELAHASGIGKASLYHHFPGGKSDMAGVLIRQQIASVHSQAFSHLTAAGDPDQRLERFARGFEQYVDGGERDCLLLVLGMGNPEHDYQSTITTQFDDWAQALASLFEADGRKPKAARKQAAELLSNLYGGLALARLTGNRRAARQALKKLGRGLSRN